ncbi:unnamed protein product [Durusdinium trenchii]|uniref:Uncharacterized protein n=2 Tax=Durusdinium trenchii TaxID=1381693 RepID=A0ABP0QDF2_9DINO
MDSSVPESLPPLPEPLPPLLESDFADTPNFMNYVDHLLKKLEVPKDMDKNFLMSLKRIELVEDCAGGAAATYAMLDFNSRLPIPWKTLSVSERCARKREWMKLHYVSHIEHMFMDMKNVAWGGHCFLHDESCFLDGENEDIYVWGPPCAPYSRLNSKRY